MKFQFKYLHFECTCKCNATSDWVTAGKSTSLHNHAGRTSSQQNRQLQILSIDKKDLYSVRMYLTGEDSDKCR